MEISEKADDLLALTFDATEEELEKSDMLSAGIKEDGRWEIIVKYNGDIMQYQNDMIDIEPLSFGFAIVTLKEEALSEFLMHPEVEFAEKPKELYVQDLTGNLASCMDASYPSNNAGYASAYGSKQQLTGKGVCIGIIDSGVDVTLPCFFSEDGKSRVLFFYDQSKQREYTGAEIQSLIGTDTTWDLTGHGTQVAVIAAGNGRTSDGSITRELVGAAPEAELIIVRLDTGNQKSFPLTTSVMRAFDYILKKSRTLNIPVAVNLSFGNSYGPHDGTSLLERYIDEVAQAGRISICIGTGNEGASGGHTGGRLSEGDGVRRIPFNIGQYQKECNLQLWYSAVDGISVSLISPGGDSYFADTNTALGRSIRTTLQETELLIYIGTAHPYSMKRELYISFSGSGQSSAYINSGTWELRLIPVDIKSGNYNVYLPSSQVRSSDTVFLQPTPELTITIPATAGRAISVGAYNTSVRAYAEFSGRGYVAAAEENNLFFVKPEIAAPGVNILTETAAGKEYVTGTSYATPFVTGAAARLMQKGIINGEDPYLYGEKLKAYLAKRAGKLPAQTKEVNPKTGYGTLCIG